MAHEWLQRLTPGDQALARAVVTRGWLTSEALGALVQAGGGQGLVALLRPRLGAEQLALLLGPGGASSSGRVPHALDAPTFVQPGPGGGSAPGGGSTPAAVASTVLGASGPSAPAGPPGLRPGARVGPYVVEKELARGGMGVVLVARHLTLGRRVALKVLQGHARPEVQERLRIEAAAAARLKHPHIVAIHEVGEQDGAPWLAMDLVDGEDLARRVERDGPLSPDEAARWMETIARAMGYAHQQAILHRDLKPQNILVDRAGVPFLVDFGLAKDVAREGQGITVTGTFLGTPAYMPPEQAGGDLEAIDRRSDVYSLGATLYHLLVGRPPFEGATAVNVVTKVLAQEPVRPRSLRPELDADLETVCMRCLEKDPAARYPTAGALADDLARYRAGEPILARPVGPLARLVRRVRRNRVLSLGLGAGAAALLLGLAAFTVSLRAERDRADRGRDLAKDAEARALDAQRVAQRGQLRAEAQAILEQAYTSLAARRFVEAKELFRRAGLKAEELARSAGGDPAQDRRLVRAAGRGRAEAERRVRPETTLPTSGQTASYVAVGGGRVAVSGVDGVRVWAADDLAGAPTLLPLEPGRGRRLAVRADGRLVAAVWIEAEGERPHLVAWDLAAGKLLWRRPGPKLGQGLLGFTSEGRLVVSEGDGVRVLVLDGETGELLREVRRTDPGAPAEPLPCCFAPLPGGAFVIGWADGIVQREPANGSRPMNVGKAPAALAAYPALTPDGWACVGADSEGAVDLILDDGRQSVFSSGEAGRVLGLDSLLTEDGQAGVIAAAAMDGSVTLWDLRANRINTLRLEPTTVKDCALLDHERVLVGRYGLAEVWRVRELRHLSGEGPVAFSRRGAVLALARTRTQERDRMQARFSREVVCLDVGALPNRPVGTAVQLPLPPRQPVSPVDVHALAFVAEDAELLLLVGDRLAQTSVLQRRRVSDAALLACSQPLPASHGVLDPAGDLLLLGGTGQQARVEVRRLDGLDAPLRAVSGWHLARVTGVCWLPGGRFASASQDGALARWGPDAARLPASAIVPALGERGLELPPTGRSTFNGEREGLLCLAASPDGTRLAVGGIDGVVRLLSADGPWEPTTLLGHQSKVVGCTFLGQGRLATVARDGVLLVWDVDTGRVLRQVVGPIGSTGLAASADGRWVAVCATSASGNTWLVDVSVGE